MKGQENVQKVVGAVHAKEEDVPGNQDVIELDCDDKDGCLYPAKHQVCHVDDDESSPPSVNYYLVSESGS